jgi:hypothetical protein
VIYGKTTGVSALGLLIAAMFWTWLWGSLGLILSTPLTVCLAVLGKYVRGLRFFAILLGEETEIAPSTRFYQRLVALDREGAMEVAEELLKEMPHAEFFDRVLIPALSLAKRDALEDILGEVEQTFVWELIGEVVESLDGVPETGAEQVETIEPPAADAAEFEVTGLAGEDTADSLALQMLSQMLRPARCTVAVVKDAESPLQAAERVADGNPRLVVLSYLPPAGLSVSRYMVSKLRAHAGDLPIVVGRWGESGGAASAAERLRGVGATHVAFSLAEARDRVFAYVKAAREAEANPDAVRTQPVMAGAN